MQTIKNNKRILLLVAMVVLVFTMCASLIPESFADWRCKYCQTNNGDSVTTCSKCGKANPNNPEAMDYQQFRDQLSEVGLLQTAWDIAATAAGANPNFNIMHIAKEIYRMPQGKWIKVGNSPEYSLLEATTAMYNVFKIVGIALILLYFLIEILDEVQADNFNFEHLIKKLITLAVAILVLMNGPYILNTVIRMGDSLLDDALKAGAAGSAANPYITEVKQALLDAKDSGGVLSLVKAAFAALGIIMDNVLPWLLYLAALLIAYLISFSRWIEILVRFAFAPVGMAPLVSGGSKSAGMRYIKKFAAVVIQGSLCVLAFAAANIVIGFQNELSSFFAKIIVPITLIGFLLKTQRIADDVVGV